jgi:hypothetical protein
VGYLHKWTDYEARGSQFIFWDEATGTPKRVDPIPNSGTVTMDSRGMDAFGERDCYFMIHGYDTIFSLLIHFEIVWGFFNHL